MYHILICDDDRDIVNALNIFLDSPDHRLFSAYTGREALEILEREEIHLVLMDIMMPEMDGISAMAEIRKRSNVPVILLTAKSEDTDKILGLNVGPTIISPSPSTRWRWRPGSAPSCGGMCTWGVRPSGRRCCAAAAWSWMTGPRR